MRVPGLIHLLTLLCATGTVAAQSGPADWVNERIGTAHDGQTFPATAPPFAMTQWTPQTRSGNRKCIAPYYDADHRIQGFRGSHFPSGSCMQDYGSITLMPLSGALKLNEEERASAFSRNTETLTPYRYAVHLQDYSIDVEMSGTTRAGILRAHYGNSQQAWMLVQCNSAAGDGEVRIDAEHGEILVINPVRRLYAGNGQLAGFSGYSVVRFDHPFHVGGTWSGTTRNPGGTDQKGTAGSPGAWVSFDLAAGQTVIAKVGTSFTSLEEARRNLDAEIPAWNFDKVVRDAHDAWDGLLGRIQVEGPEERKRIFYTALYHSMLLPRTFSDVSGTYPGFAGKGTIEKATDFTYYDDYSVWDTFRTLHPLLTLLSPSRERDMIKSLIAKGEQGGFLPVFPFWNSYTSEMIGDHSGVIIADGYFKGIRGFDLEEAYKLMRKNATELPASHELYVDGRGRRGLESYQKYGYLPLEDPVAEAFHKGEQVSRTLEYAYDDFVAGEVAQALGKNKDAEFFHHRAENYRNVIDPQTGFARGRHADGSWVTPFDPARSYPYITEGLPIQYTFFVPQDIPGLIKRTGGVSAFQQKLDTLFEHGNYDQGNEPSHHIAYLYDNAGQAWKAQQQIRQIMDTEYLNSPAGLPGNDDCGQMSAWYVMSALGFYPVAPGTAAAEYQIGTPLFEDATIRLESGKTFRIRAKGAMGSPYIQSALLNDRPMHGFAVRHADIAAGGKLEFVMSPGPNRNWPERRENSGIGMAHQSSR